MKIMPLVISSFARYLVRKDTFENMKNAVRIAEEKGGSGADKRAIALSIFAAFGHDMANWMGNLLLELAVAWLNSEKN